MFHSVSLDKKIIIYTDDEEKKVQVEERKKQIDALVDEIKSITKMNKEIDEMVEIQNETITLIEENVQKSKDKVEKGYKELIQANKYLTKRNIKIIGASVILGLATGGSALAAIGINVAGGIISGILGTSTALITNHKLSKI